MEKTGLFLRVSENFSGRVELLAAGTQVRWEGEGSRAGAGQGNPAPDTSSAPAERLNLLHMIESRPELMLSEA